MKLKLSLILILFCTLASPAQITADRAKIAAKQIIFKKQIVADDFDRQAKEIPFANVRIFVRTKLAEWLWKDGKDETGRAELLAVKTVEELYEKKDEIVEAQGLKGTLFFLLETHRPETAQRLRAKYNSGAEDELLTVFPLLSRKGNDKIVADKIKKALASEKDLAKIQAHLSFLQKQNSPEFISILSEIVRLHESRINNYSAASLFWIAGNFTDSSVPDDLKTRFYKIALNKGAGAIQSADEGEIHFIDLLLFKVLPDMTTNAPALAAETAKVKLALSAKVPQRTKDLQEIEQRIGEGSNQIESVIAEADRTDNKNVRYSLLDRASKLATKEGKFYLAVDLNEKAFEEPIDAGSISKELRITFHDQQLTHVVNNAVLRDDIQAVDYAAKKIIDDLTRADALRLMASYLFRKKDAAAAASYEEALKLTLRAKDDKSKISGLLSLIVLTHSIDPNRISEITSIAARTVNKIPTLNREDKPGTDRFKEYVSIIKNVNMTLYSVVSNLSRMNRNEAVIFANQINRKELRVVADLALATAAFEPEWKPIAK